MRAIRWSDNDRYFGPLTYATNEWRKYAVILGSGDGDEYSGCRLRLSFGSRTLIVALPALIKPEARKVVVPQWRTDGTAKRLGRDYYFDYSERAYGFSYSGGFLQVFRGRHTMDSRTDRTWGKHLPWTQWRHVRHSLYDLTGQHFWTYPARRSYQLGGGSWLAEQAVKDACPSASFVFNDYDGEQLTARTRIEEREWLFGEGWFKWLSLFRRPKVRRSLDIEFSGETGKRKGSWKGGTIGTGIEMLPGELHEGAFRRYCAENAMTFVGPASAIEARSGETTKIGSTEGESAAAKPDAQTE